MAKPDRKPDPDFEHDYDVADPDYADIPQASGSEGADPDYADDLRDPDADDGGSQEWRFRPQR